MLRPVLAVERYGLLPSERLPSQQNLCSLGNLLLKKLVEHYPELLVHNQRILEQGVVVNAPVAAFLRRGSFAYAYNVSVPSLGLDMELVNGEPLPGDIPGWRKGAVPGFYVIVWQLLEVPPIPLEQTVHAANSFVAVFLQQVLAPDK